MPTDFSPESLKALQYAAAVARKFRAQLHIVHVSEIDYAIPGPALIGADPFTSDTEEAQQLKQQLTAEVGEAIFKAAALALRDATRVTGDPATTPSTRGMLA